jgi:hypothetical protein
MVGILPELLTPLRNNIATLKMHRLSEAIMCLRSIHGTLGRNLWKLAYFWQAALAYLEIPALDLLGLYEKVVQGGLFYYRTEVRSKFR